MNAHITHNARVHPLLMVPPSYFRGQSYVKQARWVEVWQSCARLNYAPSVDMRAVHPRKGEDGTEAIQKAAAETLKYAVKPADMTTDPEWFMELTRQVHKLRFVATGGALKNVLKEGKESDEELALTDGDGEADDGARVGWIPALFVAWILDFFVILILGLVGISLNKISRKSR